VNDYSQPDFYRFNSDSLELVRWVLSLHLKPQRLLDLGAGCGVIGLEYHLKNPVGEVVLVEAQQEFLPHLERNSKDKNAKIRNCSFAEFSSDKAFDLILCNPPYYLEGRGERSLNLRRHQARTFVLDGWPELLKCIERSLSPEGRSFIVVKDDPMILKEIGRSLPFSLKKKFHQVIPGIVFLELARLDKKGSQDVL
jgi:tRNA1Val (adenine37-N6)-methyltransferase